jgi:hypothetical protein
MVSVVEFQARDAKPRKARDFSATAEIIIFPGVRFERLVTDEALDAPEPTSPRDRSVKARKSG